jgi:hypothetical protein
MASLCNMPSLSIPIPTFDILAIITAMLKLLGITLPAMPTIPFPAPFCPLD